MMTCQLGWINPILMCKRSGRDAGMCLEACMEGGWSLDSLLELSSDVAVFEVVFQCTNRWGISRSVCKRRIF